MIDPRRGGRSNGGPRMKGDAEPRFGKHRDIVGAVADGECFGLRQAKFRAQPHQRVALGRLAAHRLGDFSRQFVVLDDQRVGFAGIEAEPRGKRSRKLRKSAGDERRERAMRAHRRNERHSAGHNRDPRGDELVDDGGIEPGEQRDALAQSGLECDFAAHGARRDLRDMLPQPDEISKLVNTFLYDDGRIHVGDEQLLSPPGGELHDDVDWRAGKGRSEPRGSPRRIVTERRCKKKIRGDPRREPLRLRIGQKLRDTRNQPRRERRAGGIGDERSDMGHERPGGRRPSAILIAGPTASGKSGLALRLAERFGGAIVNADSMQVYRDLAILTARPTRQDEACAPHQLFGHVDGAVNYSVGRYLEDAAAALEELNGEGRLPIFVGGTGLYFKALTQGISDVPHVSKELRAAFRARAAHRSAAELHVELAACDPAMAEKLRPSDPQRILRALEVYAATGRSLASFQGVKRASLVDPASCVAIFVTPERAALKAAIDERFNRMLQAGALDEVAKLRARGLDPALPVMRALGVPYLLRRLKGEIDLDEAARLAKRDTHAYAKRQFTFARHQLPEFRWAAPEEAETIAIEAMTQRH